jgi:type ISP restriction-modification system protein
MSDTILPLDLPFEKIQCFPLSHITVEAVEQFRNHYNDPDIVRQDIFHYLYAVFNHLGYRERYVGCLKLELPRIPYLKSFRAFAQAGCRLAALLWDTRTLNLGRSFARRRRACPIQRPSAGCA